MNAAALDAHLASGATHVCTCWSVVRRDGFTLGFTDHDRAISFDGIAFMPESGLTARALASTTGLSVNNTEAIGVLAADAISEADIEAGRYDGAQVTTWLVQWDNPEARTVRFVGTIGEITRASGGFQADLRGLTDTLNQVQGRSYLTTCSAVLGDTRCGFDTSSPAFSVETAIKDVSKAQVFLLGSVGGYNDHWFQSGVLEVLSGAAQGLRGVIKLDRVAGDARTITLWQPIRASIVVGDMLRLVAGCDKRAETCREKFANLINFQGFPDIPGEDWLVSIPRADGGNTGSSRSR
ncbi:DUF2163 domain-containing protein [Yoonia sp.]|jgi:uncharacterized phage protein (TIGR02218 family)|uniref:DUF2163 domain-containing protein n=1 Tax=Yoonia sp. TaxID=2212373 RepID=UPI0025E6361A|nr:DUF2163 domain-containing protein [Yoonia sp.]